MAGEVRRMPLKRLLGDEANTQPMTVADRLAEMIGRTVVVSGTFPIPVGPQGQVAYAPAKGVLKAVYLDGFDLLDVDGGDTEPETYLFANVRCVQPISSLVKAQTIAKPGSN